ncbi:hypothetical protein CU254_27795 [Amycolatopsis sp. AA4]|uniref:hypothetical protein n=1 Tax=Actinomycetes TaxID=1760 RepID=UPI0001B57B2A|nr:MULTISPECIES: hypothetical protein [Actinomycetes]ATY13808.1 hypothetical protein CU254_27795 [Amycolatopsis sp. AA4]
MTMFRADLTALFETAGMTGVDLDAAVVDEHVRSAAYRRVVAARGGAAPRELAAVLVRDPEPLTAKTAVVELVDQVARETADPAEFRRRAAGIVAEADRLGPVKDREFVRQRARDWEVWLETENGRVPDVAELESVSDWMQRRLADFSASRQVLAVMAEHGRTKKIRNTAANRAA